MLASALAVLLAVQAAAPATPAACRMADDIKTIAVTKDNGDAFRKAAALLAEQGKWRAAVTAQESAGKDDASALLLAYYVLRSGDVDRTDQLLRDLDERQRASRAAHWVAAELAIEREDYATAAEELETARVSNDSGFGLPSICCGGRAVDLPALDTLLRARVALLQDDAAAAVQLLREIKTPEGRLYFARALNAAGRTTEAVPELEKLASDFAPCAGVWREHVLFEAALAASETGTDEAERLYGEAIEAAEAQERAFNAAIRAATVDLQTPVMGLFVAASREPRHAAPESRNNLGHLLIARAGDDVATLALAQTELRKAAQSRDYATPEYAYIGLARAALAAGDRETAATETMHALWRAPRHDEALELARSLIRDAPIASRLGLGVVFNATTAEALPRRFAAREYGRELAQLDEFASAHDDDELARHFAASYALAKHEFERARTLAASARTEASTAEWPDAVEAIALAATGRKEQAKTLLRALQKRVAQDPPRTPWDAATLRTAALGFSDLATENRDAIAATAAAELLAEVSRPADASGHPFPWEPRTALAGTVTFAEDKQVLPGTEITVFTENGPQTAFSDEEGRWRFRDLPPGYYSVLAKLEWTQPSGRIEQVTTGETAVAFALELAKDESYPLPSNGRSFQTFYDVAAVPGIHVSGSAFTETTYVIDGATVADTFREAVEELTIAASGYSAEFGLDSSPIVSRLGANDFTGKVTLEVARDTQAAEPVAVSRALGEEGEQETVHMHAGGPLQRERLFWYFSGDLQRQRGQPQPALQPQFTPPGDSRNGTFDFFGKLTRSSTVQTAYLSARVRQADRRGVVDDPAGSAFGTASSVDRRQEARDDTLTLFLYRIFGGKTLVEGTAFRTDEHNSLRPGSRAASAIQIRFPALGFFTAGGVGFINDGRDSNRAGAQAKVTTRFLGEHDVVAGANVEWDDDAVSERISGGMLVDEENGVRRFWTYGDDPDPAATVHEAFKGDETSAFVNDRWTRTRFSVSAGIRWTRQHARFPRDFQLSTSAFQPRLGFVFDPRGDALWKVYTSYSRSFRSMQRDERVAYGSDRRYVVAPLGQSPILETMSYGRLSAIDPNLRARLTDVVEAGVEHGSPWNWRLGAQHQRLASHIEDFFCTADRRRCIGNPGRGIMQQLPRAERELVYVFSEMWHTAGSASWDVAYTWLHSQGNTEPPDLASTRVIGIDPYARPAFDTAVLVSQGDLGLPRHSLRATGFVTANNLISTHDVVLSATVTAQSGLPRGAFGYSPLYGRYVTTLAARGEEGNSPVLVGLHAGLDYAVPIGKQVLKLSLIGRNLLGSQTSTVDDQRAVLPASDLEPAPNPTFLQPMERTEPRSLRALIALTF
jgi:hypothetical protein